MDFKIALQNLKGSYLANTELLRSEQDTKRVLIVPFMEALGYDTRNPAEFLSEVSAPGGGGRVDYAVMKDGNPAIIMECKQASKARLLDERGQLQRYFNATKCDVAILTNGIQYQFFSDLDRPGVMDSEPFLVVDLSVLGDEDFGNPGAPAINALAAFTKAEFSSDSVRAAAMEMKQKGLIRTYLEQQFNGAELDPQFAELLARKALIRGNLTPAVKENLTRLSLEVISEFKAALSKPAGASRQYTTTSDEVEGYYIVKNILWNDVDTDRVVMRDAQTYCTIRLDDDNRNRRTICRLRFNSPDRKSIGLFDTGTEDLIRIDALGEINQYADRLRQTVQQILERER